MERLNFLYLILHRNKIKIYIELDYSAQEIISKSERINIIQLVPYVCMEIDTCAARGEEQHIKFGGVKNV